MKFNVPGKAFVTQLQAVSKVINAKNAISILDNFLFRLEGDNLYITGSDSDNIFTACMQVMDAEGEGSVALPSKRLLDVAKEVSGQPLTVDIDEEYHVTVTYSGGKFEFSGVSGAEYPRKKEQPSDEKFTLTLPADVVAKGLDTTLFAVSLETIRPIMTGILWDVFEDSISFVSSDTHKLVLYSNRSVAPGQRAKFIFPAKPAGILRSVLNEEITEVQVEADAKSATFRFGAYELSSRLIKGNYPDYTRVIPKNNPFRLVVSREALLTATRRVSIFSSSASNLIRMSIDSMRVDLDAQDVDYEIAAHESVPCEYEGNPMKIGFKAQYMKEVLSNLKNDEVLVELSDPARPGLFKPAEQLENEEIVMLQMPMQVFD